MISSFVCCLLFSGAPTLKVRVDGDGYLRFAREGRVVYAAAASLTVEGGELVGQGGASVIPAIHVPGHVEGLTVDLEGNVSYRSGSSSVLAGRFVLALFPKNEGLHLEDGYLVAADRPLLGNPGEGTNGVIRSSGAPIQRPTSTPKIDVSAAKPVATPKVRVSEQVHSGAAQVTVAANAEVAGDQILLGQIAEVCAEPRLKEKLEAVYVGDTPAMGVPRTITAAQIEVRLRAAGIKPEEINVNVPAVATVSRKGQRIAQDLFIAAAKAAAKEKLGVDLPLVCTERAPVFVAPLGQVELTAESCVKTTTGVSTLIAVRVDGKRVNSRAVNLTMDANAQGVKAGETVKILIHSGGATFQINGKARGAGWVGQQVTVVTDTGSTHSGIVLSAGVVEVKL